MIHCTSLLILPILLLCSCSETVTPVTYPVELQPSLIERTSPVKAVVRDGDQWKETGTDTVDLETINLLNIAVQIFDTEIGLVLLSDNTWRRAGDTVVFPYEQSGLSYTFVDTVFSLNFFTSGTHTQMQMNMLAAVVKGKDEMGRPVNAIYRYNYNPASPFDLFYPQPRFQSSDTFIVETVFYKTFDMIYSPQ